MEWTVRSLLLLLLSSSADDTEYLNRGSSDGCLGHFGLFVLLMMHAALRSFGLATDADNPFATRPHFSATSSTASRTAAAPSLDAPGARITLCRECRKKKQPSVDDAAPDDDDDDDAEEEPGDVLPEGGGWGASLPVATRERDGSCSA